MSFKDSMYPILDFLVPFTVSSITNPHSLCVTAVPPLQFKSGQAEHFCYFLFFPVENCVRVFHRDKCSTSQNKKSLLYSDEACPFFFKEQNMCSYENRRVWLDAGSRPKKQRRIASICQRKMWKWTMKKMNTKNRLSRPIPLFYHP